MLTLTCLSTEELKPEGIGVEKSTCVRGVEYQHEQYQAITPPVISVKNVKVWRESVSFVKPWLMVVACHKVSRCLEKEC